MVVKVHSEKQLVCQIQKYAGVIIYGAGMVGELVCKRLSAHGLEDKILSAAVSDRQKNTAAGSRLCGIPVKEISELTDYRKHALVIVATLPNVQEEIGNHLAGLQFQNIMYVSPRLYQDLFRKYIPDFKKQHPIKPVQDARSRILFVASDNNSTSGAFLCLVELCDQLQKRGVAVWVILPTYGQGALLLSQKGIPYTYVASQDWGYEIEKNQFFFEKLKFFLGMMRNRRAKNEMVSLMKEHAIDLVHCNTTYAYIGALAAKSCGLPFVWHLREWMEDQGYRIFMPGWGWNLIRQADRVIAVSEYIKSLIPLEDKSFAKVVYDTVEMDEQACVEREILRGEIVQMIMVGGLTRYKRQRELIDACAVLKGRHISGFHLTIVGRGDKDYTEELKQAVFGYGIEDLVTFYGMSSNVSELYTKADFAFMCSIAEPYGRVTVEAQRAGCLVIGADSGATPELVRDGETGYLYEAGDSQALAEKIIFALNNPETSRKIARAGQEYANKTYTKERNIHEILDIYESILGRKI